MSTESRLLRFPPFTVDTSNCSIQFDQTCVQYLLLRIILYRLFQPRSVTQYTRPVWVPDFIRSYVMLFTLDLDLRRRTTSKNGDKTSSVYFVRCCIYIPWIRFVINRHTQREGRIKRQNLVSHCIASVISLVSPIFHSRAQFAGTPLWNAQFHHEMFNTHNTHTYMCSTTLLM